MTEILTLWMVVLLLAKKKTVGIALEHQALVLLYVVTVSLPLLKFVMMVTKTMEMDVVQLVNLKLAGLAL
jgi:hypothetical protein